MKIRHFVLDSHAQLRKFSREAVHEILAGRVSARAFDPGLGREMALVTVVCDDDLIPENAYLLRVPLYAAHSSFDRSASASLVQHPR